MPEVTAGGDAVTQALLDLLRLREAALRLARPQRLAVQPHLEDAALAGDERDLAQLLDEGRQQLLRQPGGAQQPAALGAVLDLEPGRAVHRQRLALRGGSGQ